MFVHGVGELGQEAPGGFSAVDCGGDGAWRVGVDGVRSILIPHDQSVELVVFEDKTLVYVKSRTGYAATYRLEECQFDPPATCVLMDLDGTTVQSEAFWRCVLEGTVADARQDESFRFEPEDLPHVSGRSVAEHLSYCIAKYCSREKLEAALARYDRIATRELEALAHGGGRRDALRPAVGLKRFLLALKQARVRIALVTSGLHAKAWPQIQSVFEQLGLGNPLDFYDAFITAGTRVGFGRAGTLAELPAKPHPWLYAEAARIGLGIERAGRGGVVGIEDSAAGVVSVRLAGFSCMGLRSGNIGASGLEALQSVELDTLEDALPIIFGEAR